MSVIKSGGCPLTFRYLLASIAALTLLAGSLTDNAKGAEATNIRVIDGDTFECDLELEFRIGFAKQMVRVYGFDAWESRKGRGGLNLTDKQWENEILKGTIAKRSLESLLKLAKKVTVREVGEPSFGRYTCEVYADGVYVADYMKGKGHERK